MNNYKEILRNLEVELDILETEVEDTLVKAGKGIKLTRVALKDIRDLVTDCEFETKQDEISF